MLVTVVFTSRRKTLTPATKPPPEVAAELPWTLTLSMYICELVSPLTPPGRRTSHTRQSVRLSTAALSHRRRRHSGLEQGCLPPEAPAVLSATVVSATRRVLSCTNMPPPFDPAALPTTSEPSMLISTRDIPHIPPARAAATTNVSAETGRKDP